MRRILENWWFWTGLVMLLLVLVLCVGLPLFIGGLRPWWIRTTIFVVIVGSGATIGLLRIRRQRKAAEVIATELAAPSAADQEGAVIAARMADAMASLKSSLGGRRDYLYSRPWYVIIGPPGAGKTTALLSLQEAGPGAWVSTIVDRNLYQHGYFYLAVRAAASGDEVRQMFPSVAKIGAVEKMRQIVDSALPGVPLRHTPTPPPQLRVLPGYVYFELDRGAQDWRDFSTSTALGLHLAGEWPQLQMELWCVKRAGR